MAGAVRRRVSFVIAVVFLAGLALGNVSRDVEWWLALHTLTYQRVDLPDGSPTVRALRWEVLRSVFHIFQERDVHAVMNPFVGLPQAVSCTVSAGAATCNMTIGTALTNINGGLVFANGGDGSDQGGGTADAAEWNGTYNLTSTTNVAFDRTVTTSTSAFVAKATVWEINPFFLKQAVQRGIVAISATNATTGTASITAVDTTKAAIWPCGSKQVTGASASGFRSLWLDFSDTTHVRVNRHAGDVATTPSACYQIVERR